MFLSEPIFVTNEEIHIEWVNSMKFDRKKYVAWQAITFLKMVKMLTYSSLSLIHQPQNPRPRLHLMKRIMQSITSSSQQQKINKKKGKKWLLTVPDLIISLYLSVFQSCNVLQNFTCKRNLKQRNLSIN
jgi:hypothetical protein